MRLVKWTDEDGLKHQSWIKDHESDKMAPEGILNDPPSLDLIDWEEVKRLIHNRLVDQNIQTWDDITKHQNAITTIVSSTIKRYIIALFRESERDG